MLWVLLWTTIEAIFETMHEIVNSQDFFGDTIMTAARLQAELHDESVRNMAVAVKQILGMLTPVDKCLHPGRPI